MRALPLGPSVEHPMGPRNVSCSREVSTGGRKPQRTSQRLHSQGRKLMIQTTIQRADEGPRETLEGCAKIEVELHAVPATGAFGGAPYTATKRVRGAPKYGWNCMRTLPLGPSAEHHIGATKRVRGAPKLK
eukprot:2691164-Pyramimonas_sp.AAC.1